MRPSARGELEQLVAAVPALTELWLGFSQFASLRPLRGALQLRFLRLHSCESTCTARLLELAEVHSLRRLSANVPKAEVEAARALLSPPSRALPQLTYADISSM